MVWLNRAGSNTPSRPSLLTCYQRRLLRPLKKGCLEIYNPSPVPPYFRLVELSVCWKLVFFYSSDIQFQYLGILNMLYSSISACKSGRGMYFVILIRLTKVVRNNTIIWVNFVALERKFFKICSAFLTSHRWLLGNRQWDNCIKRYFLSRIVLKLSISREYSSSVTSLRDTPIFPASIWNI
jgi:hypothetical protein